MKRKTIWISVVIIVAAAVMIAIFKPFNKASREYTFDTAEVVKNTISNSVTATGTLEAITTVEVGTQVSGVIENIYADFNSNVKKGQLLAELDKTPLQAQLDQSKATVDEAEAELEYQASNFERLKALYEKNLIAKTEYDQALYNYKRSMASLTSARSMYDKNRINLEYATITSPIDGVILDRAVEKGQTVAASFSTPTLFTIAQDLTRMQVESDVDEADIGSVKEGQRVEFEVDAYPDDRFAGTVTEVRLKPEITNNVVTYTVIIDAPNPDMKLMPGMTASITVFIEEKSDVLTIPGKALRFIPEMDYIITMMEESPEVPKATVKMVKMMAKNGNMPMPGSMPQGGMSQGSMPAGGMMPGGMMPAGGFGSMTDLTMVWVKDSTHIRPAMIKTGIDNGSEIEVLSGLKAGDLVVLAMSKNGGQKESGSNSTRSPFMPRPPGRR